MNKKTKQKIMRVVAMYLAINLLAECIAPIPALALTGGPSQPEVESFEPVSTTEMVNLFTGDFNYNIPLLTVPGPNGGYPINLAYHAGIGMEQEASWVGLGWNINPGVINRNMRGLPDDFDGDEVTKTLYYKPQFNCALNFAEFSINEPTLTTTTTTVDIDFVNEALNDDIFDKKTGESESFGFEVDRSLFSYQIHFNNYRGIGYGIGLNLTSTQGEFFSTPYSKSLSLSFDTDGGLGVSPSISFDKKKGDVTKSYTLRLGYNSRTGMMNLAMSTSKSITKATKLRSVEADAVINRLQTTVTITDKTRTTYSSEMRPGASVSFSSVSGIPSNGQAIKGSNVNVGVVIGKPDPSSTKFKKFNKTRFEMSIATSESKEINQAFKGYGFIHTGHGVDESADSTVILDFNRTGDAPANKNASAIQSGYGTSDVLYASGQGVAGAFRPFRSEVGVLFDAAVRNHIPGATVILECGTATEGGITSFELGGDYGVNYSTSYSGDWNSHLGDIDQIFFDDVIVNPLDEPVYYKSTGETTSARIGEMSGIGEDRAVRFNIRSNIADEVGIVTKVLDKLVTDGGGSVPLALTGNSKRISREKRNQLLSYRTSGEIANTVGYGSPVVSLYSINSFPIGASPSDIDYSNYEAHHIGELTVTNPDGTRYVYGLPVYNTSQKEVLFAKDDIEEDDFAKTHDYSSGQDNQVGNSEGNDNLYMSTEIPAYAYSYLVTAIYSPDYVDLTGNGPTDDDFGYWVKFNYSLNADGEYSWRVPYRDAKYSKGHISDLKDDKLSYMYGTKEIYYLNSIETKTHEAHFILNDNSVAAELRADANGVMMEDFLGASTLTASEQQHYLKSIELISKADPNTPLKTVHFEYDFSLCGGVMNNIGTAITIGENDMNAAEGKLTLKSVWFTNLGNEKGRLSPYIFSYDEEGVYDNPDYSLDSMDRWGNYMPDREVDGMQFYSSENPYVYQGEEDNFNDEYASAWNLKKITLPSGGEIEIEYECDDYAFVQDQQAMQLQRIVGLGTLSDIDAVTHEAAFADNIFNSGLGDRYRLVFFELERPLAATTDLEMTQEIAKYVETIDDLYFKVFMELKDKPPGFSGDPQAYDYVEGYCKPDKSGKWYGYGPIDNSEVTLGWIKVKNEERNPWNPAGQLDQPFKLAGWQYLRMERPDLFDDGNLFASGNNVTQSIQAFINLFNDAQKLFGYFRFCQMNDFCSSLYLKDDINLETRAKPSYLRLNSPDGIKYGGGHRVKSITIHDNWDDMAEESSPITASYGTSYEYRMPDGTSSGVAEYEPLIGGEENALRKPLHYQERMYPYRNDGLYAEEPFGEDLYPGASVGYSRIVVRSINNDDHSDDPVSNNVTVNRAGISVTEFYTARNFPVLNDYTDLEKKNFAIPIPIWCIGEISYNNKGYSQGFCLELNNMHGQVKSQAVYAAGADIDNSNTQPTSQVEYIYQTDPAGGPEGKPKLSNRVTVLTQDGVYEDADVGKTHEFYIDRQQHSNFSVSAGLQTNAGAVPPYVFWTNMFPYFEISTSMYRSISTMKIIQRNGVLSEVREYKDGAFTINKTLMYDAETGQPLLTQTINNYNRPVYTYNYASHWAYDGMGPAYKNVGAFFDGVNISAGVFNYTGAEKYFVTGDEMEMIDGSGNIEIIWVTDVDAATGDVTVMDEAGDPVTAVRDLRIIRSGRRNQQISTNGVIVSLSNPVTERKSPFFKAMNDYNATALTTETVLELNDFYTDCFTGALMDVDLAWNNGTHTLSILTAGGEGGCEASIVFNGETDITVLKDLFDYTLFYVAATGQVIATKDNTRLTCTFTAQNDCFHTCLDNVLHAEAYRFKDNWDYNYLDFGNPSNDAKGLGPDYMDAVAYPNDYRFGTKGIWRMEESWLYQVDRKQDGTLPWLTSVAGDGTYKHFVLHNWGASVLTHDQQNPQWTLTNTVTQYDPHGYEVENVNPLGVYSSAMYGYGSSMPVAVASNTRLGEMAFEGFEDYANVASYEADDPHGHCDFYSLNGSFPIAVNNTRPHTGTYAMAVVPSGGAAMEFTSDVSGATRMFNPIGGNKYHVSVWVNAPYGVTPSLVVKNDGTNVPVVAAATVDMSRDAIDGWRQINYDFVAPASTALRLELTSTGSGTCFFDDLRIQPYTSGMKTYVYNPLTFWLVAELDDRNFATFYNYDEQGALVQVKKETEKGIVTVSTSRANTKR